MDDKKRYYIAIDLKSFYASVECVERGLNPLNTNLVVADTSRTDKTICLAVTPSLKKYGIPGRARLFEVVQAAKQINAIRLMKAPNKQFTDKSIFADKLDKHPEYSLDYIAAPPRMRKYMEYSTNIYNIYLKYISPEDIHVYSVDEVFIDATNYLKTYRCTAKELAVKIIKNIYAETNITATAGIGTNMYLCKVALDIMAKKNPPDENGIRLAELDEISYRENLWNHRPLTDFWRVGKGYIKKLEANGIYTMGDIARCSVAPSDEFKNEELLYKLFGINAQLLIDHAWGWEPCTIKDVKSYTPMQKSISSGQVLPCPYSFEKAKLVIREMAEILTMELVRKKICTNQIVITVGYDIECLKNPNILKNYNGTVTTDYYGRKIPKHAHSTINLSRWTSSAKMITNAVIQLFEESVNPNLLVRRMYVVANNIKSENCIDDGYEQLDFFTTTNQRENENEKLKKEHELQLAMLHIEEKYGKNVILKGMNLLEGATTVSRNQQVGGHKA